jgi:hypothetical protein
VAARLALAKPRRRQMVRLLVLHARAWCGVTSARLHRHLSTPAGCVAGVLGRVKNRRLAAVTLRAAQRRRRRASASAIWRQHRAYPHRAA